MPQNIAATWNLIIVSQFNKNGKRVGYFLKKALKVFRSNLISGSWEKNVFHLKHDYPGEITPGRNQVKLDLVGLTLEKDSFGFVLDRYDVIRELHNSRSAKFSIQNGSFLIDLNNLVLNPTTSEELFIIEEIFIRGSYNYDHAHSCIVIDVGMNVGIASLFFASKDRVEKVYGFEPFLPTFGQAETNFRLNPRLSGKIQVAQYGLGGKEEELVVSYDYKNKGQVGIHGTSSIRSSLGKVEQQTIEIKEASTELKTIIDRHPGKLFILKLDCEGAEYAILQNLFSNDLLQKIKVIFIEWHLQGPEPLIALLGKSNFTSFYQQSSGKVGMIYASR